VHYAFLNNHRPADAMHGKPTQSYLVTLTLDGSWCETTECFIRLEWHDTSECRFKIRSELPWRTCTPANTQSDFVILSAQEPDTAAVN